VNPVADLSNSIRGWADIVTGRPGAIDKFRLGGSGLAVAFGWLVVAVLLSAAAQSAAAGVPSLGVLLLGLAGQAITIGILALVMLQTLRLIHLKLPLNVLFVPLLYALSYMFVVAVPLGLFGPLAGGLVIVAVGFLIYRAARVLAGMGIMLSMAFAVLCIVVLVIVPNALYMLFSEIPSVA
jgi:hypothetical protein